MQLYEVHSPSGGTAWRRTQSEAHEHAKLGLPREEVSITLRDYPSDQATFCTLFNGGYPEGKAVKRWKLTAKGGLHEVPVDGLEDPAVEVKASRPRKEKPEAPPADALPPDQFWAKLEADRKARKGKGTGLPEQIV